MNKSSIPRRIIKNTISLMIYISKTDKAGLIILIAAQISLIIATVAIKFITNPNFTHPLLWEILEIALTGMTDGLIISIDMKPWKNWKSQEIENNIVNKHIKI